MNTAVDADEPLACVQLSISFILITVDNGLMTTPLCGTFFDQQEQLASNGGMAVRSSIRVLCCERSDRWLSQGLLGISCFQSASAAPWTDRGLWALGSGIVAGLVIDLIFVNLVSCLSSRLSAQSTANTNAPLAGELARIQPCKQVEQADAERGRGLEHSLDVHI